MSYNRMITQTFTSSGSWTCPAGVTEIVVLAAGGGSGGGSGVFSQPGVAGQGGDLMPAVS